jgi:hypothetical protein
MRHSAIRTHSTPIFVALSFRAQTIIMTTHASAVISIPCDMPEGYIFTTVVDGRQLPGMCDRVVVRSSSRDERVMTVAGQKQEPHV